MSIFVGAVADDDTGATDLAGMLTEQGMRVCLVLDAASPQQLASWTSDCDAIVIGVASRSIAKADAYERTFAAVTALRSLQPHVLAIKYCSTFDSTAEGNIGASIDAAMDATGECFTIALPALPALGRTTYMGHHFVGRQLLSESSMSRHPLTPMTNSHLPSHLQTQTARRVGLVTYADGAEDVEQLRNKLAEVQQSGSEIALLDCVDAAHLQRIGESISELPLLTGSSAWAMVLPRIWREKSLWAPSSSGQQLIRADHGNGMLIVSGSCSEATQRQNEWAAQQDFDLHYLDAAAVLSGEVPCDDMVCRLAEALSAGRTCVLSSTCEANSQSSAAVQTDLSAVASGERIAQALSHIVRQIFTRCTPQGLIVAGGETSSTLMRALDLGGLRIGPNIEPGVPVCVALSQPGLGVVLKSGNFGSTDFYGRAIEAIRNLPVRSLTESEYKL